MYVSSRWAGKGRAVRGGAGGEKDIYAGVVETAEPSLTSEGAGLLTALR